MSELFDDVIVRTELIDKLKTLIKNKRDYGKELAENERLYRLELTKTMSVMLIDGWEFENGKSKPIAATSVYNLARGIEAVANLRAKRDGSQVLYDTIQENIYFTKKQIDIIESDIKASRGGK